DPLEHGGEDGGSVDEEAGGVAIEERRLGGTAEAALERCREEGARSHTRQARAAITPVWRELPLDPGASRPGWTDAHRGGGTERGRGDSVGPERPRADGAVAGEDGNRSIGRGLIRTAPGIGSARVPRDSSGREPGRAP